MDIRFTLQAEYASPTYSVTLFNLYGYTSGSPTANLLASNVTKAQLLAGHIVTTNLIIVSGYIQPLGACSAAPQQTYSLEFLAGPIIVGTFSNYAGQSRVGITKLNNSLTLDTTFNVGSGFGFGPGTDTGPMQIVKQSNGKIVVAGTVTSYDGVTCSKVIRLNPDGSKDYTFSGWGATTYFNTRTILTIDTQTDNKIIVGGANGLVTDTTAGSGMLVRLELDGSIDNTFASNVLQINGTVRVVLFLPNDNQSILVAGNFLAPTNGGLYKVLNTGAFDFSFPGGFTLGTTGDGLGKINCMSLDSSNRIMIGGSWTAVFNGISVVNPVRINSAGVLDTSWYPKANGIVSSILEQPGTGGKVIIAGTFSQVNVSSTPLPAVFRFGLARISANGVNDATWTAEPNYSGSYNTGWFPGSRLSLLSNGNILFIGSILSVNNNTNVTNVTVLSPTNGAPVTSGISYGLSDAAIYRDAVSF